jgi:hypothetical protein
MKTRIFINILFALVIGYGLTSCLEGDEMNTPPGGSPPIVEMSYVAPGGTLFNSGLEGRFFAAQALLLSPSDESDTITFAVTIQGRQGGVSEDVNVTLQVDPNAVLDNLSNDKVEYSLMSSDHYTILNNTATIHAGESYVEFKAVFYPSKMDFTKSTMLPITATNDAGMPTSSNYGKLYFHVIGNPIAGLYTWQFIRYSDAAGTGSPDGTSFSGETTVFSPVDPTTINVPTGYYDRANYIITFDNDGNGNLSNFKAVLDPVWLAANWDTAGIQVASGPTITVSPDYTTFTIKYTTLTRNVTDIYVRQ